MKFAVSCSAIPASAPIEDWTRYVAAAEAAGMVAIGAGDITTRNFECYVTMTMLALSTSRAKFLSTITNPVTRHPAVVAASWASLQKISGGRAIMGIGTGNSAVINVGLPSAKLADLREHVLAVRALIRDGIAEYRGKTCHLPWAPEAVPEGVPIYLAADGPKALELAGEIADGVLVGGGVSAAYVARAREAIARGAAKSGRAIGDLDIWHMADISIADTQRQAIRNAADILSAIASMSFRMSMEGMGVPEELRPAVDAFNRKYQYDQHISGNNGDLLEELGLGEFFADRYLIAGSSEDVVSRLARLDADGVSQLYIPNLVSDPFPFLARFSQEIEPGLRRLARPSNETGS